MTLMGAIKQLHELRRAEDMPIYYKPAIAEVINVLLMDTQEVRHGHWIWMGEQGDSRYMCSVCKSKEGVPTCNGEPTVWEYCPNCGAKMDGDRRKNETIVQNAEQN